MGRSCVYFQIVFILPASVLGSTFRSRHGRGPVGLPFGLETRGDESDPVIKMPPRGSDPLDPMCLADTGFKCGDGKHNCNDWVACSNETFTCTCHHWGCADSSGVCRPVKNEWFTSESRLMSIGAAKKGIPHRFVTMKPATNNTPTLQDGWPAGEHPEALWKFLLMNDNATLLIATKQGKFQEDGHFLSLPPAPWQEDLMIAPIQVKPKDALQASWRLLERPRSRTALQHIPSGRFLCYDSNADGLSTCAGKYCGVDSADFEIWPRIVGVPTFRSVGAQLPEPRSSHPRTVSKADPTPWYLKKGKAKPVPKKDANIPWYLRKKQ